MSTALDRVFTKLVANLFCLAILLMISATCYGDLLTFQYAGNVDFSDGSPDSSPFGAFVGNPISLDFTFDTNLIDSNISSNGDYAPVTSIEVVAGSNTYTANNTGSINIINNGINPDQFILNAPVFGPAIGGFSDVFLNLILTDNTKGVFSTDALPLTQPNPSDFSTSQLRLDFTDPSNFDDFGTLGTNTVTSSTAGLPSPKLRLDVVFTDPPEILDGQFPFGFTEFPEEIPATFLIDKGTSAGGGATGYGIADVLSASLPLGDGVFTELAEFDLELRADGTIESLDWRFSPITTPSVIDGRIVLNSPLHITGTDIASGEAFSYSYANSTETITFIPEPSTLALCLGLVGVGVVRRRRQVKECRRG